MTTHDDSALNDARPQPEFMAVDCDPVRMRSIIEGLRGLPNVSDMPVIQAISELDRIASMFERADKRRREMAQEMIDALRSSILEGKATATDGCECPRCMAIRSILANESKTTQLNS